MTIELPSPCVVVLVGPAGSGKTTWAGKELGDYVVSTDALRDLVGEGDHDLRASTDAFAVLEDVLERRCRRGLTTVVDSLGTEPARREAWRSIAARHSMVCVAVLFDTPPAVVRRQNRARAKRVPDNVLRRQLAEWPGIIDTVRAEPFAAVHVVRMVQAVESGGERPALVTATMRTTQPRGELAESQVDPGADERSTRLQFGLQISRFTWPGGPATIGADLRDMAVAAERAGVDSLWVMDHFRQIPVLGPPWLEMLESWTTLAHLAACTQRIRLGPLVTGITYRNVAHLAKIVATLDVLSGGRVNCGIGLAWFGDEHHAYGWRFPSVRERYAILEEALQLLPQMWGPGNKPFNGTVLRVPDTTCYPRPLQARVPILVGGSGERRTLQLVARHADACNLFGEPEVVARKVAVLRRHCEAVGRDPADISVTHLSTVLVGDDHAEVGELVKALKPPRASAERFARDVHAGTVDQHVERVQRLAEAGVDHVIVGLADLGQPGAVERYGRLISRVHASR